MKKPRKSNRSKLPPPPTGFEILDLEWAAMAPRGEALLAELPLDASDSWGTEDGMLKFIYARRKVDRAAAELAATTAPTLVRLRQRELQRNRRAQLDCTMNICSALARSARQQHPNAVPGQVLLLIRDQCKTLLRGALRGLPCPE